MQINIGDTMDEAIVKNMLQAHTLMSKNLSGNNVKPYIKLSKFLFKVAQKNRNNIVNIIPEDDCNR